MAYNKKDGIFDQEDESILLLFAKQAGILLSNSLSKSDILNQLTRSKRIIGMAICCLTCTDLRELSSKATNYIMELINAEKVTIWFHNKRKNLIIKYVGTEETMIMRNDIGIVGRSISTSSKDITIEPQTSMEYDTAVDIATELPLVTLPIRSVDDNQVYAVCQFVHLKSYFYHESHKRNVFEQEMIELLEMALCAVIHNKLIHQLDE